MSFFKSNPLLNPQKRFPEIKFGEAAGENLPYCDGTFKAVICRNVIDHVFQPEECLSEMHRVMRQGGFLLLSVNVYSRGIAKVKKALEFLSVPLVREEPHPHIFTEEGIENLLKKAGFKIINKKKIPPKTTYEDSAMGSLKRFFYKTFEKELKEVIFVGVRNNR
jgi:ubiquinone/menaquinone biosynthesis C-methylase UbiE